MKLNFKKLIYVYLSLEYNTSNDNNLMSFCNHEYFSVLYPKTWRGICSRNGSKNKMQREFSTTRNIIIISSFIREVQE